MAFALEIAWASGTLATNVASTNTTINFVGGGAELVVCPMIIDTSNGCTGASFNSHTNLARGTSYTATAANGYIMVIVWGVWSGPSGNATLNILYSGGNTGTTGGKLCSAVFTGQATGIIASPGPSGQGNGTASPAAVTITGAGTGDMVVAIMNNIGAHNFSAGSGYTLQFNTSAWSGNVTGVETTTGLSEPGGNPVIQASFPSGPSGWNMLAADFPVQPAAASVNSLVYAQRKVLYFI